MALTESERILEATLSTKAKNIGSASSSLAISLSSVEETLYPFAASLLSDEPLFFLVNSYTTGLSPAAMQYIIGLKVQNRFGGKLEAGELGLSVSSTSLAIPCGASARWQAK